MDRIHATPTTGSPTQQADEALRRVMEQPSLSTRLLNEVADQLTAHTPQQELSLNSWSGALVRAAHRVLATYPDAIADSVVARAFAVLPPLYAGDTQAEYAIRLRTAAKALR